MEKFALGAGEIEATNFDKDKKKRLHMISTLTLEGEPSISGVHIYECTKKETHAITQHMRMKTEVQFFRDTSTCQAKTYSVQN